MGMPFPTDVVTRKPMPSSWTEEPYGTGMYLEEAESGFPDTGRQGEADYWVMGFSYPALSTTMKEAIQDHWKSARGSEFSFRHPLSGEDWDVFYAAVPTFVISGTDGSTVYWTATLKFIGKEGDKMRIQLYKVTDLSAGNDITDRPFFVCPNKAVTVAEIGILTHGTASGVDNSNTVVITIKDDAGNTIAQKTYNTSTQPPSSDYESLGSLTYTLLNAGEHMTFSVTQGSTADMPQFQIIVEYYNTN